jgi:hypothetical protein
MSATSLNVRNITECPQHHQQSRLLLKYTEYESVSRKFLFWKVLLSEKGLKEILEIEHEKDFNATFRKKSM